MLQQIKFDQFHLDKENMVKILIDAKTDMVDIKNYEGKSALFLTSEKMVDFYSKNWWCKNLQMDLVLKIRCWEFNQISDW